MVRARQGVPGTADRDILVSLEGPEEDPAAYAYRIVDSIIGSADLLARAGDDILFTLVLGPEDNLPPDILRVADKIVFSPDPLAFLVNDEVAGA